MHNMKTKKKILYLSPSNRMLGARISLLHLLKNLNREKYEPVVVSLDNDDGFLQELDKQGVRYYRLRLWNWRKGKFWWRIPFTIWRLVKIIRKEEVDLVHSNEFWCTPYAVIAGKFISKIPVVTHIRLFITPKKARQYCLKWADCIISVSHATGSLLKDWKYYDLVKTVYNGLDPSEYTNREEKRKAFREEFHLKDTDIAVGEIAQLDPRKNQHRVLEIIPKIIKKYPNVRFFFIGGSRNEQYKQRLLKQCRELNIEKYCCFTGSRDDVPSVCAGLDINILPSKQEGFGRSIIESMYMKTPHIGSNVGGIPEVIDHGKSGYVFPIEQFEFFEKYLEILIEDDHLRRQMGEKGFHIVNKKFLASICAQNTENIYDCLIVSEPNNKIGRKK